MSIEACGDLRQYFHERLQVAQERVCHHTDDATEYYLVDLLTRFGRAETGPIDAPLVYAVADASAAVDPRERFRLFRQVGDTALYTFGVFPEDLSRRGLSETYVVTMGRRAYRMAGLLARVAQQPFPRVFGSLLRDFEALSMLLAEALEEPPPQSSEELIRLYSQWRRTGSERLAARLRAAGVQLEDDAEPN